MCIYIYLYIFIHIEENGTTLSYLLPEKPNNGCPSNTVGCSGSDCNHPDSCFCEQHCSWEMCKLHEYPNDCLVDVKSVWKWDSKKHSWVAQVQGKITYTVFDVRIYKKLQF